jgi:hypothetical protein
VNQLMGVPQTPTPLLLMANASSSTVATAVSASTVGGGTGDTADDTAAAHHDKKDALVEDTEVLEISTTSQAKVMWGDMDEDSDGIDDMYSLQLPEPSERGSPTSARSI